MTHVFIPSKGRPNNTTTKLLSEQGVPHTIFVEPQDFDNYNAVLRPYATLVTLPENDRGLAPTKNFILDYAKERNIEHIFMFDDDLIKLQKNYLKPPKKVGGGLYSRDDKTTRIPAILEEFQNDCIEDGVTYGGFDLVSHCGFHGLRKYFTKDGCKLTYSFFWLNLTLLGDIRPVKERMLFDDCELIIQILLAGGTGVKNCKFGWIASPMGDPTNAGGCGEDYDTTVQIRQNKCDAMKVHLLNIQNDITKNFTDKQKKLWGDKTIFVEALLLEAHPERGMGIAPHYRNIHLLNKIRNEPVIRPLPPGLRLFGT